MPKTIAADIHVNAIFETTNGPVVITEIKSSRHVKICFVEYPCEIIVRVVQLRNRMIRNPMRPTTCDIGFLGIGPHVSKVKGVQNPVHRVWSNMFFRVYSPATPDVARVYAGTSVHSNWHNFQNFAEWYHNQIDRFGPVKHRWHLDKDLLIPGNRVYGPDTCCLIPLEVNELFTDSANARGEYPMGVNFRRTKSGTFEAQCKTPGSNKRYISSHNSAWKAQIAYWEYKFRMIQKVAIWHWQYIPYDLACRLLSFGWDDARAYYGDDAIIRYDL